MSKKIENKIKNINQEKYKVQVRYPYTRGYETLDSGLSLKEAFKVYMNYIYHEDSDDTYYRYVLDVKRDDDI